MKRYILNLARYDYGKPNSPQLFRCFDPESVNEYLGIPEPVEYIEETDLNELPF